MITENEYNCSNKIWKKFSDEEKKMFNEVYELFIEDFNFPPKMQSNQHYKDWVKVIAHNLACNVVWNKKLIITNEVK